LAKGDYAHVMLIHGPGQEGLYRKPYSARHVHQSAANTATKKKGQISRSGPSYFLVRLAGIEPTTPWFVAKYSIQLSYSRPRHAL
jgi:hypothetical protein